MINVIADFIVGLTFIILGWLTIISDTKKIINKLYICFSFLAGTSAILSSVALFFLLYNKHLIFIDNFKNVTLLSGIITIFIFAIYFPEKNKEKINKAFLFLYSSVLFPIYMLLGNKYYDIIANNGMSIKTNRSIYYKIYSAIIAFYVVATISIGLKKWLKLKVPIYRKQLKFFLFGGGFGGLMLVFLGLIPISFNIQSPINGINFGALIFGISLFYGIIRYQIFDIKTALHYFLFWFISLAIILSPIVLLPSFMSTFFAKINQKNQLLFWGICTILYFFVIQKTILPIINKISLRKKHQFYKEIQQFIIDIQGIQSSNDLLFHTSNTITRNLHTKDIAILTKSNQHEFAGKFTSIHNPIKLKIQKLNQWINYPETILSKKTLYDLQQNINFISSNDIHLIAKLQYNNSILGFLCLTNKKTLKPYRHEENIFITNISKAITSQLLKLSEVKRSSDIASEIAHEVKNLSEGLEFTITELTSKNILTHEDKKLLKIAMIEMSNLHKFSKKHIATEMLDRIDYIEKKEHLLSKTIKAATLPIQAKLKEKKVNINIKYSNETIIYGDEVLLKIVFVNLLDNAIKYLDKRQDIEISCLDSKEYIHIKIKDYGQGIDKEKKISYFKRWFQDGSGKYMSSGLGLQLCYKIIHKHSGSLNIDSTINKGTTIKY